MVQYQVAMQGWLLSTTSFRQELTLFIALATKEVPKFLKCLPGRVKHSINQSFVGIINKSLVMAKLVILAILSFYVNETQWVATILARIFPTHDLLRWLNDA